ncbi:hypothetical protein PGB90_005719 [Kerria lacca]
MDNRNWITGYSQVPSNLRYFANNFQDKQKYLKLKEKEFASSILESDFLKLKNECLVTRFTDINDYFDNNICNICFKNRKNKNLNNYYINLLDGDQLFSLRNTRVSYFKYLRLFFTNGKYNVNCNSDLLQNKELLEFLEKSVQYYKESAIQYYRKPITYEMLFRWTKKAIKTFNSTFSSLTLRAVGFCWYFVSFYFIQKLIVSSEQMEIIKKTDSDSHFPLLKIPIIFMKTDVNSKLMWLYRKFGALFFTFSNPTNIKYDILLEAWIMYIEENLKCGNNLLFYLEDESDDFILKTVVESIKREAVQDVLITNVNINYEKEVDKFFNDKLPNNSLWSIFNNMKKMNYNYGYVNVSFQQPFSLKEIISSLGENIDLVNITYKIYIHMCYDFYKLQTVNSTNLICFILLKKFRNGIKFADLVREVDEYRSELKYLKIRIGFTGNSTCVVNHVIKFLGPKLISVKSDIIKPVTQLPYILEIAHYANNVLHHFMMDCVIMTSVAVLLKHELEEAFKTKNNTNLQFYYSDLLEKCNNLYEILQFEYTFQKPCQSFISEVDQSLFKFVCSSFFTKMQKMMTDEEQRAYKLSKYLDDTDSDDSENEYYNNRKSAKNKGTLYKIDLNDSRPILKEIMFYKNCLKPFLDAYAINADNLKTLIGKQITESCYYKKLLIEMQVMLEKQQLQYPESISQDILKNSIKLFKYWNVVQTYKVDEIAVFYLSQNYNNENKLLTVIDKIKIFL